MEKMAKSASEAVPSEAPIHSVPSIVHTPTSELPNFIRNHYDLYFSDQPEVDQIRLKKIFEFIDKDTPSDLKIPSFYINKLAELDSRLAPSLGGPERLRKAYEWISLQESILSFKSMQRGLERA